MASHDFDGQALGELLRLVRTLQSIEPSPIWAPAAIGYPQCSLESIGLDFITKLPVTSRGNDAIVTFIDRLTKRAHWYAIRESMSAKEFADLFVSEHVRLHGLPNSIISDRDARFTSDIWRRLNELWKVKLRMRTAFHPQSDGQMEKANDIVQKWL